MVNDGMGDLQAALHWQRKYDELMEVAREVVEEYYPPKTVTPSMRRLREAVRDAE